MRSAPAEDIVDLVPKIWETNFKVLDDIKVRLGDVSITSLLFGDNEHIFRLKKYELGTCQNYL